jgi:hypothetical protein
VRLGVEMTASDDRRQIVITSISPGKNISHIIDLDAAAYSLTPTNKQVASISIFIG